MLRFLLVAALLLVGGAAIAAPSQLACTFDDHGLASLTYGGVQFLKPGASVLHNIAFADDKGRDVDVDKSNPTIFFDRTTQQLSYSWPWGAVRYRYRLAGNRLNIEVTVENDTAGPMSSAEIGIAELHFPRRPLGQAWEKWFEYLKDNESDVTAIFADYQTGSLIFCNDDPRSAIRSGFVPGAPPPQETWLARLNSPERLRPGPAVFVEPRSSKTFHFSLRFSEPGVPLKAVIGDLIEKFVAAHPFQLKWPDRRPIGMLMMASSAHSSATNPRGWFNEPKDDFVGKNGLKHFRTKAFEVADRSIAILKSMGAQGMIFWDMEGEQYPNINFVGDPRMTAQLAPEMEAIAPEFFERFHQAGLRTGVCIRPSHIVPSQSGKWPWEHNHLNYDGVEEMHQKIAYARKRLGCLLFYVDSNVRYYRQPDGTQFGRILEGAAFKRLADMHPDVLIIPELPRLEYWSCTAPYQDLRPAFGDHAATEQDVLAFYPRAFSVINPIDGPVQERRADLIAGQRRGDTLLFPCWFADVRNKLYKAILDEADRK